MNDSNATVKVGKWTSLTTMTSGQRERRHRAGGRREQGYQGSGHRRGRDTTTKAYTVTVTRAAALVQNHPAPTDLMVTPGNQRLGPVLERALEQCGCLYG